MKPKILILTASAGSAHNLTAIALEHYLYQEWGETIEIRIDDIFVNSHGFTHWIVSFYNWIHRHAPWFHHFYFHIFEVGKIMKWGTKTFVSDYYKDLVKDYQPDWIFSVFCSLNSGYFEVAKSLVNKPVFCITICPEYTGGYGFSRHWVNPQADHFWCHTEEVKQQAIKLGMASEKIILSASLLRKNFHDPQLTKIEKQQFLIEKLQLNPDKFTLLLSTNGAGSQNHITFLKQLLPLADRIQIIVLCGKNSIAHNTVSQWCQEHPLLQTSVLKFTEKMSQLLQVSQAIVQRPGFLMTAESVHCHCPIIFNGMGGIMPQESLAVRYLVPKNMAVTITRPRQLFILLQRWLDSPEIYQALCYSHQTYQIHPTPPEKILEQLWVKQLPVSKL